MVIFAVDAWNDLVFCCVKDFAMIEEGKWGVEKSWRGALANIVS
jgi:hypothetical protein